MRQDPDVEGWVEEWENEKCGCTMLVWCEWEPSPSGRFYAPRVRAVSLQRSLFCDSSHPEVESTLRSGRDRWIPPSDRPATPKIDQEPPELVT